MKYILTSIQIKVSYPVYKYLFPIIAFVLSTCTYNQHDQSKDKSNIYIDNARKGLYKIQPLGENIGKMSVTANISGVQNNTQYYSKFNSTSSKMNFQVDLIEEIWINILAIKFVRENGEVIDFESSPGYYNLLDISEDLTLLFGDSLLPEGRFNQIRLVLADPNGWLRKIGSDQYLPLTIPSAEQTGIKIDGEIEIVTGFIHKIVLDFNISDMNYTQKDGYKLSPVISIKEIQIVPPFVPGTLFVRLDQEVSITYGVEGAPPATGLPSIDQILANHNAVFMESIIDSIESIDDEFDRSNLNNQVLEDIGVYRDYYIGFDENTDVILAWYDFLDDPHIEEVFPDTILEADITIPNDCEAALSVANGPNCADMDPAIAEQENYLNIIGAFNGWDIETGSENISIAVLDDGIRRNHPDLDERMREGPYYEYEWCWKFWKKFKCIERRDGSHHQGPHGTQVVGVLGAITNNEKGIAAINWVSPVWDIGVTDPDYSDGLVGKGLLAAVSRGADVINMSFGGYGYRICRFTRCRFVLPDMYQYTRVARDHGIVLVASAGNDNREVSGYPGTKSFKGHYPSSFPWVISVAGLASSGYHTRADFGSGSGSNFGKVDIAAPYDGIYTTNASNGYSSASGTSVSAPMVAGLASLILSLRPGFTPDQVKNVIFSTATDLGPAGKDEDTGYGRINIDAALRSIEFSVGGGVVGLSNTGLVLQLNGSENLPISENGVFTFSTAFINNDPYQAAILSQPVGQNCIIHNETGSIFRDDIRNILVQCATPGDVTPATEVSQFVSSPLTCGGVELTWVKPPDIDFFGVILVRNATSFPAHASDGDVILDSISVLSDNIDLTDVPSSYTDLNVTQNNTYYYSLFTVDTSNNISSGAGLSIKAPTPDPDQCSNGTPSGGGSGCFIATSAFGTPFVSDVVLLREFRDSYLLKTDWGKTFVLNYYKFSPPIANYIAQSSILRGTVRFFLKPLSSFSAVYLGKANFTHVMTLGIWFLLVGISMKLIIQKVLRISFTKEANN